MGPESLFQDMWELGLWDSTRCRTTDGVAVSVIDPGRRNCDAGPDFFNAKINIGGRLWAGNVELHVRASDWHRHHHDSDPAYANIILHVVAESDCIITRPDGTPIPQIEIPYVPDLRERFARMFHGSALSPKCAAELAATPGIYITQWLSALGFERLYAKVDRLLQWHHSVDCDWQATAYVALARALGFSTNSDAFEYLARTTPLRHILRHSDSPELIAAALYGQAGFLDAEAVDFDNADDIYYREEMRRNYLFLRSKYGWSESAPRPAWRMGRLRPANFPHRRIALLVALITGGFVLGRSLGRFDSIDSVRSFFDVQLPPYWIDHYDFGRRTAANRRALSPDSVNSLIINAVVPLMYCYSLQFGNEEMGDRAVEFLMNLPPENNFIVREFTDSGIPAPDAFTTQAMVQLHKEYCAPNKCMYCRLGRRFFIARNRTAE